MSMSKKVLISIYVFIMLFSFSPRVNASSYKYLADDVSICKSFRNKKDCTNNYCIWTGSDCVSSNVAENPCDEQAIRRGLKILGYVLLFIRVAVPLIIVGYGTIDLFKSVVDKDEKSMGKQIKQICIRIFTGFIIFFIPNLINAVFGISDKLNIIKDDQFLTCSECVLEPTKESRCVLED